MADQLNIANRALLAIGGRAQISSLDPSDGSVEADAITQLWQPTFEQLARTAPWNCLGKQVTLSLIAAASGTPENPEGTTLPIPPTPWLYAYAYPSDCLDVRYIVPSYPANTGTTTPAFPVNVAAPAWLPTGGQIPFKVQRIEVAPASDLLAILTNQELAQAVYTVNSSNPQGWDSLFQEAMVASLGAFLVPALTLDMALMDRCVRQAEAAIKQARIRDGNEGVTSMDHLPDWMQARYGGQGYTFGFGPGFNSGCGYSMVWPGFGNGGTYGD